MSDSMQFSSGALLHNWTTFDWTQGVQLESLEDFTELRVETLNSVYEITVIDGTNREVLVRGGRFFPQGTPARIAGSSLGGSFLKIGGIYCGFRMEIVENRRTIITSTVQTVTVYSVHQ